MGTPDKVTPQRREGDKLLCLIALRAQQFWDFIDKRQIDAQIVAVAVLAVSYRLTDWAMSYAMHGERPGVEVAMIIGAVVGPWSLLQGAAIKFYFDARKGSFDGTS